MSRLRPLKPREVIGKLKRFDFEGPVGGGGHPKMFYPEKGTVIPILMHKGEDVSVGLIREIINEIRYFERGMARVVSGAIKK